MGAARWSARARTRDYARARNTGGIATSMRRLKVHLRARNSAGKTKAYIQMAAPQDDLVELDDQALLPTANVRV